MKLINADLLLDRMSERCEWCTHNDHRHTCRHECEWREAMDMVDDASEVEAEPVRHAHWVGWTATHWTKKYDDYGDPIFKEHTYYQCSKCRRRTVIKSAYCPVCGCKMDEVSE